MSVEVTGSELQGAKAFIDTFVEKCASVVYEDVESLPKRPFSLHCSKYEVEGECRYVALEYLLCRYVEEV